MKLFGFGKKEEDKNTNEEVIIGSGENSIIILGEGCDKCSTLFKNTVSACKNIEYSCVIKKASAISDIGASYEIYAVPVLIINEEIKTQGEVLSERDIVGFLQ